jgi:hypothetical protein
MFYFNDDNILYTVCSAYTEGKLRQVWQHDLIADGLGVTLMLFFMIQRLGSACFRYESENYLL